MDPVARVRVLAYQNSTFRLPMVVEGICYVAAQLMIRHSFNRNDATRSDRD